MIARSSARFLRHLKNRGPATLLVESFDWLGRLQERLQMPPCWEWYWSPGWGTRATHLKVQLLCLPGQDGARVDFEAWCRCVFCKDGTAGGHARSCGVLNLHLAGDGWPGGVLIDAERTLNEQIVMPWHDPSDRCAP